MLQKKIHHIYNEAESESKKFTRKKRQKEQIQ